MTAEEVEKQKAGPRPILTDLPEDPEVDFKDERVRRLRY